MFRALEPEVQKEASTHLVGTGVVHDKVEPQPESWIAGVWTDEQIIFVL
jgi:hypothetical protein